MRRSLLTSDFAASLNGYQPEHAIAHAFRKGHRDDLSGMLSADTNVLLPDDFLTKVDRASMAHSLEVREPLMDHELIEWLATLPTRVRFPATVAVQASTVQASGVGESAST